MGAKTKVLRLYFCSVYNSIFKYCVFKIQMNYYFYQTLQITRMLLIPQAPKHFHGFGLAHWSDVNTFDIHRCIEFNQR